MVKRWSRSHPWAASYIAVIGAVVAFMVLASVLDFAESAVVLFALCAVAMGGFLLDYLKRPQTSQRAQTE